jgi:hypothetical protein
MIGKINGAQPFAAREHFFDTALDRPPATHAQILVRLRLDIGDPFAVRRDVETFIFD